MPGCRPRHSSSTFRPGNALSSSISNRHFHGQKFNFKPPNCTIPNCLSHYHKHLPWSDPGTHRLLAKPFALSYQSSLPADNKSSQLSCPFSNGWKWTFVQKVLYIRIQLWQLNPMPRLARFDASGVLHHVMGRGIERKEIFFSDADRSDFLDRLAGLVEEGALDVYAWVLMPNQFHLLCKTRNRPLSSSMRKILTGYVVNLNRRHCRYGHLFQNRYKSIVCQEDRYLKELVRF